MYQKNETFMELSEEELNRILGWYTNQKTEPNKKDDKIAEKIREAVWEKDLLFPASLD